VKLLLLLAIIGALLVAPFLKLKQPWAVKLWRRVRLFFVIYVVVIFLAAVVRLALNWDAIYG
jgi:hypothetical protein